MEAIILAGGLGTRLQGVIGAYPKCMAPVNGKPFLAYIFDYLERQECTRVVLSLGYKHEVVAEWLNKGSVNIPCSQVIESEPLGTGGGIQLALGAAKDKNVVILNGDTFFDVDLQKMMDFHLKAESKTTLALKQMREFERYGVVNMGANNIILSFEEKKYRATGLINGGVYIVDKEALLAKHLPQKFSFEKDYLERYVAEGNFCGYELDGYFIDIGIPEDYARVKDDFKKMFS